MLCLDDRPLLLRTLPASKLDKIKLSPSSFDRISVCSKAVYSYPGSPGQVLKLGPPSEKFAVQYT